MRKCVPILIAVACLLFPAGCSWCKKSCPKAQAPEAAATAPCPFASTSVSGDPSLPHGVVEQDAVVFSAKVVKIDHKKRLVTLEGPTGNQTTIKADDSVKNLDQVKKGDVVKVAYYESIAFDVNKAGTVEPGVDVKVDEATAPKGQKPAGMAREVVTVTSTLVAIDPTVPSVTLKGPEGNLAVIKVQDPKNLDDVKVGDMVDVIFTEAVAISVEKPAKK